LTLALAQSSWPHPYGSGDHARVSSVQLTTRGQPLWSVQLGGGGYGDIVIGASGRCFVSSRDRLTAVDRIGHIDWSVRLDLYEPRQSMAMAGGGLLGFEFDRQSGPALVIRDEATGAPTRQILAGGIAHAAPVPGRGVGVVVSSRAGNSLRMIAPEGDELWRQRIDHPAEEPPLVWDDGLAIIDGDSVRAYDLSGELLWSADHAGFYGGDLPTRDEHGRAPMGGRKSNPVVQAGPRLLVADLETRSGGGVRVLDVNAATVIPLDTAVQIHPPYALPQLSGHGRCLVTEGPRRQVAYNVWEYSLVAVQLEGTVAWKHTMDAPPHGVIADAAGTTVTWSTPTEDRWSKYSRWFDLSTECIVRAVSATGEQLWTWSPPGPITATPAIGAEGEVYFVAGRDLWALG
jgi:hypothetical protein